MKSSFLFAAVLLAAPAFADTLTPSDLFKDVAPILASQSNITEVELCVEGVCETFDIEHADSRKGGTPQVVYQRPKTTSEQGTLAKAMGDLVEAVGGKVGAGGRVVIDWEKKPDGTEKLHIEGTVGVGSAAAPAATAPATSGHPHKSDLN